MELPRGRKLVLLHNLKCRCRFDSMVVVVMVMLSVDLKVCLAQSLNDAAAYLNTVEGEVMRVAAKATENFVNTCDLVESCEGSCSRQSCEPLEGDLDLLTCKNVALNAACSDDKRGCTQLRVTLSKSFVRVPTPPDVTLTNAAKFCICSQRMLDPVFRDISTHHNSAINLTLGSYFGSVEGVQRSFPGRDSSRSKCTFEPRKRPWYLGATALQKDLMILLDGGNSMGGALPGDFLTSRDALNTKFSAAVNTIQALLDTLTYGDSVSVVLFSSSSAAKVVMTLTYNGSGLEVAKASLGALSADPNPGVSNLDSGMRIANETFSRPTGNALKVLLLITDGQFATRPVVLPQKPLTMIYSFDRSESAKKALSELACAMNGTYNRIETTVTDPLWTLRSYFGILASWRLKALGYRPYWMKPYNDSGGLSEVITVAYPVFAPDNFTLIGVAASDVLLTELGSFDTASFSAALMGRPTDDPLTDVASQPVPCNVKLSTLNTECRVTAGSIMNPMCPSNDTSNVSFEDRLCTCPPHCRAPTTSKKKKNVRLLVVAGVGGALAFIVLMVVAIYCCTKRSRKIEHQVSGIASTIFTPAKVASGSSKGPWRCFISSCLGFGSQRHLPNVAMSNISTFSTPASRRTKSTKTAAWPARNEFLSRDVTSFSIKELEDATGNWSGNSLVGTGGCGRVYKGILDGELRAIKRPRRGVEVAHSTFEKELELLSSLNHRSLVRLIGYNTENRVLVFEYMERGTLDDCLHCDRLGRRLTWEERLRIAAGAAKGLEYLHEYATPTIIHGDVKPGNILLDANLEPHLSDFGLSLSVHGDESTLWASKMGGTPGYFDPEYAALGSLTSKSDVYSFGIVLLEILSGRKAVQGNRNITAWASEMYKQEVNKVLDPSIDPPTRGVDCLDSIIALALQCVQVEHQCRPKMKDVFVKLSRAASEWHRCQEPDACVEDQVKHPSRRQHPLFRLPSTVDPAEILEEPDHHHVHSGYLKMSASNPSSRHDRMFV